MSARPGKSRQELVSRVKYNQLQNHLANVTRQLEQQHQQVEKLSGLRDLPTLDGVNLVFADVITFSGGMHRTLIINRGRRDHISKGQLVIAHNSIIGTICDVSSREARVKLITAPDSTLAVTIKGVDLKRMMQGNGDGTASIPMISSKYNIKAGTVIYACKRAGLLDAEMITGTIIHCEADEQRPAILDINVKPACDIESLRDVAVIVAEPTKD